MRGWRKGENEQISKIARQRNKEDLEARCEGTGVWNASQVSGLSSEAGDGAIQLECNRGKHYVGLGNMVTSLTGHT